MNRRSVIVVAMWLVGPLVYLAICAATAHVFSLAMLDWARQRGASRGIELEFLLLQRPVFILCFLWGTLYASALAKPAAFGYTPRILKHLACSYVLCLVCSAVALRIELMPLPDFQSTFAVSAFIFAGFSFSALCFLAAIAAWAHLVFSSNSA